MERYRNTSIKNGLGEGGAIGKPLYVTTIYPEIPVSQNDTYVITGQGDRFDLLALQFYGDPSLWWIISIANPTLPQNSLYPPTGTQIRIPANSGLALIQYNNLNGF
jgi:phage tail protein X